MRALQRSAKYLARERPKLSDPAHERVGLQPERDGRVRCSPWLGRVVMSYLSQLRRQAACKLAAVYRSPARAHARSPRIRRDERARSNHRTLTRSPAVRDLARCHRPNVDGGRPPTALQLLNRSVRSVMNAAIRCWMLNATDMLLNHTLPNTRTIGKLGDEFLHDLRCG